MIFLPLITWMAGGVSVLVAGFLRGLTGFGFAQTIAAIGGMVLLPRQVVALVLLLSLAIGLRDGWRHRRDVDWVSILWLLGGYALGLLPGLYLLGHLDLRTLRLLLGVIVLGATLIAARPLPHLTGISRRWGLPVGIVSGVAGGLAGISGPPAILYFLAIGEPPARMRANLLVYFPLTAILALPVAAADGLVGRTELILAAGLLPVLLVAQAFGTALFHRLGGRGYRGLALGVLGVMGTAAILRALLM